VSGAPQHREREYIISAGGPQRENERACRGGDAVGATRRYRRASSAVYSLPEPRDAYPNKVQGDVICLSMHVESFSSLDEFHRVAVVLLSDHEAEHGLLLGVSRSARDGGVPPDVYAAAIMAGGEPVAVALRTTSKLILSREVRDGAARMLAGDALARIPVPHSVLGPPGAVAAYATEAEREGLTAKTLLRQGIYELRTVTPPPSVPGGRRVATLADVPVLVDWQANWIADEGKTPARSEIALRVRLRIERGEFHLWESAGQPVASAATDLPSLTGRRINGVYTPPALRGHGYASALVASLSQHVLDTGYAFAFLHTDLANATSNSLYRRIGYRPVGEVHEIEVGARRTSTRSAP
jgi:predicted GNAT family acetyltransferase